jgi:hypothetical protein
MPRFSSKQLYEMYANGFNGCIDEPDHYEKLMHELKYPYFGDASRSIKNSGKGKLSTPFRSVLRFDQLAYEERQTTGDCVSHGTRNAVDLTRAVEIHVEKEKEAWIARGATEAIYGSRGHGGQGMSCSRAAEFVNKIGGVLVRKNYEGIIDLTKYNSTIGSRWGSSGVPESVKKLAQKHQIQTVSNIQSVEEARDALANGYGLSVCSSYGFSNKRNDKGISNVSGSWAHCMAWIACDDTGSEPLFLVQNSWGKWNGGGHPDWGKIPDGSFLITADVAAGMIRGGGAFAFSAFDGFPPQKLPNYGFSTYL